MSIEKYLVTDAVIHEVFIKGWGDEILSAFHPVSIQWKPAKPPISYCCEALWNLIANSSCKISCAVGILKRGLL